ncbi:stAR-related lipid transfer protein 8 isoform A [Alligator mississippiensis]|uniref:StAR-related lipid transfer protein 13 n=1 Tax=Alligator mississippiensis TaxID=8496 RepID=A0A151MPR2_ALLMI|nr:stAR-related lipid transfer protein 8 isoform A [Alligator mississippiensis]
MLKQVPRTSGSNCYLLNSISPESQKMCLRFDQTTRRPPYRRSRILARRQLLSKIQQEIEAKETCDWLRAAGFPQYAHLYEDSQFPIDIAAVKTDHDFLDKDLVEPLCRRLNTLNKCASMKLDVNFQRKKSEDSDEEDLCAISNKWTFQRTSRRWSRVDDIDTLLHRSARAVGEVTTGVHLASAALTGSTGDLLDLEKDELFPHLDDILQHVNGLQEVVDHWSKNVLPDMPNNDLSVGKSTSLPFQSTTQITLDFEGNSVSDGRTTPSDMDRDGASLNESEATGVRDRRDSGVGASLTRPSRRLRWNSFQISHSMSQSIASLQISNQSAVQLNLLQKFSLLRLTAIMEKYSMSNKHGWTWSVPKFMKRMKVPDYKDKNVFGVPLIVHVQRTGQPLPQSIQQALRYLRSNCLDQVGLFRKSGVKSRIQALRQMNESSPENVRYEDQSAYDVADMVKQFFRDLPEPLLTSKLGETFLHIYQYVPQEQRLQAVQAAIMLMSDENREALQTLLCFLSDVNSVEENQMTPMNLAVCLAPSLFHLNIVKKESSPRVIQKKYATGKPDQKDLSENLAATQGLAHMIMECNKLFEVPHDMVAQSRNSYVEAEIHSPTLEELGKQIDEEGGTYQMYIESLLQNLQKEAKEKFKGWITCPSIESTELTYKKVGDGNPLRLWKVSVEVEAPPSVVLNRVLRERHLWDEDFLQWKIIETLDKQTEIYQYVLNSMAPHPVRDFVVLRTWRTDLPKGMCMLVAVSVEHEEAPLMGSVRAIVMDCQYLIEPCGSGKSRLTHICRIDLKGHSPEWYNKGFGHLCAAEVARIRNSFQPLIAEGPETKI